MTNCRRAFACFGCHPKLAVLARCRRRQRWKSFIQLRNANENHASGKKKCQIRQATEKGEFSIQSLIHMETHSHKLANLNVFFRVSCETLTTLTECDDFFLIFIQQLKSHNKLIETIVHILIVFRLFIILFCFRLSNFIPFETATSAAEEQTKRKKWIHLISEEEEKKVDFVAFH